MSVATPSITTSEQPVIVSTDAIWRFSVEQYHAMIQAGILTEDDPVELLEGWLITKMSKNPRHTFVTQLARDVVTSLLPAGWYVNTQEPVTTNDSEPEPDVAVVRGTRRQDIDRHPGPQDLALVIEVADSSLQRDRSLKKRLCAAAGIPMYWIVNLIDGQIEVYSDPSGPHEQPDYGQRQNYSLEDAVPVVVDGQEVGSFALKDLLP